LEKGYVKGVRHKSQSIKGYKKRLSKPMAHTKKRLKQPSKGQQDVQNQAGVERGVGRVQPSTT